MENEYKPGLIAVASSFLGRYREFDECLANTLQPEGSRVEWLLGLNIAQHFNRAVKLMLKDPKFQWVWILGDDHTWPPDLLKNLLDRNVSVVLPLCVFRARPYDPILMTSPSVDSKRVGWEWFKGKKGLVDISGMSTGNAGMLIRREVIEKIPPPWFTLGQLDPEIGSPDIYFCKLLKEYNIPLHLDLDNVIGHITHVSAFPSRDQEGEWRVHLSSPVERHHSIKEMKVAVFNGWREAYDGMSWQEQKDFYNKLVEAFPDQCTFHPEMSTRFFRNIPKKSWVMELGGLDGRTADFILKKNNQIDRWVNYEVCSIIENYCKDKRYKYFVSNDFPWKLDLRFYDILYLSHILEHIKEKDIRAILRQTSETKYIYADVPIPNKTEEINWTNYLGTHILEIGWEDLEKLFGEFGFEKYEDHGTIRFFKKTDLCSNIGD